jgi:hypothetical protein
MMESLLPIQQFTQVGQLLALALVTLSCLLGLSGLINIVRPIPQLSQATGVLFLSITAFFLVGFAWICWFHYQIYVHLPLELPSPLVEYLNRQLEMMNRGSEYSLPLYSASAPPRYVLPPWLEYEKYYFWFMCYACMALVGHFRLPHIRLRSALQILLVLQVGILFWTANPFTVPLPKFFDEVGPWFTQNLSSGQQFSYFMRLYPKMNFYYNAEYMLFHPPLLFLSYACITMTFVTSSFMLVKRELATETMGYDYAKLGFFMLTLGMLLGYPWALKAWGPNWWWDPKICSSIMMWAIYSTYLHTRLYANKPFMWYFSSILGILCFLAMIFTFVSSFFFPGEHTFV